jgi:hypothetical protein
MYDLQIIDESAGYAQWPAPGYGRGAPQNTRGGNVTAEVVTEAVSGGPDGSAHIGIADMGTVNYSGLVASSFDNT